MSTAEGDAIEVDKVACCSFGRLYGALAGWVDPVELVEVRGFRFATSGAEEASIGGRGG